MPRPPIIMKIPVLVAAAAVGLIVWGALYLATPPAHRTAAFTVAAGEGTDSIVRRLKQEGLIRSTAVFKMTLKSSGLATKLQPGTYDLGDVTTYRQIIDRLAGGGIPANEVVLRVIEGWDLRDIKAELVRLGLAGADGLYDLTGEPLAEPVRSDRRPAPDYSSKYSFLSPQPLGVSLEGYLFPDTYRLYKDAAAADAVEAMLKNFQKRLAEGDTMALIGRSGRSLHEILTMASIIEKEVRSEADRQLVSDIFWRRLERGMPLQADSTVNYVTGKSVAAASAADLAAGSRYNTYKYAGLPPGPICNPGLSAIRAAASPRANGNWYFLTDREGKVHYAGDLDEHNRNKARYLK
jgi:UPF0755 protein